MAGELEIYGEVVGLRRLPNSTSGSPQWEVTLNTVHGTVGISTAIDSQVGLAIHDGLIGEKVTAIVESGALVALRW